MTDKAKEELVEIIKGFVLKKQSARMAGQNTMYAKQLAEAILSKMRVAEGKLKGVLK